MAYNITEQGVVHVSDMEFEYTLDSEDIVRVVHPTNGEISMRPKGNLAAITVAGMLAARLWEQYG